MVPALQGKDLIARAKTGTGKTLAFGIPILKSLTEEFEQTPSMRYFFTFINYYYSYTIIIHTPFADIS